MPVTPLFDLHTHTVASGHAYGTLRDNISVAKERGLLAMGTSDHSPGMEGTTDDAFFQNYRVIPDYIDGVRILKGMEANVTDFDGTVDGGQVMEKLDYVIASLHSHCIKAGSVEDNTRALIGAMKNPQVKIIGHPDDGRYPLDYDRLVPAAVRYGVALEINNSSLRASSSRKDGARLVKILAEKARHYGAYVVMGSDAHIWLDVGRMDEAEKVLREADFPEERVLNYSMEGLRFLLRKRTV